MSKDQISPSEKKKKKKKIDEQLDEQPLDPTKNYEEEEEKAGKDAIPT